MVNFTKPSIQKQHSTTIYSRESLFHHEYFNQQSSRKSFIYNQFNDKRPANKQLLLEAVLALIGKEASQVGLEKEATVLTHSILKRNYLQCRS